MENNKPQLKNNSEKILRNRALVFLGWFLLIYLVGYGLYNYFIRVNTPEVDPITHFVSTNTAFVLDLVSDSISYKSFNSSKIDVLPYVSIYMAGRETISIAHECNGVAVMILFLAFIVAFSGLTKQLLWFIPAGLFLIHLANLFRLILLTYLSFNNSSWQHFAHKFLFTAIIYMMVFLLWMFWVNLTLKRIKREEPH